MRRIGAHPSYEFPLAVIFVAVVVLLWIRALFGAPLWRLLALADVNYFSPNSNFMVYAPLGSSIFLTVFVNGLLWALSQGTR